LKGLKTVNELASHDQRPGKQSMVKGNSGKVLLVFGLGLAVMPALLGAQMVQQASDLYTLASQPWPYFQPSRVGLLYLWVPVVVVSGFVLYLLPGGLLTVAFSPTRNPEGLIVLAFGWSTLLEIGLSTAMKGLFGFPLTKQSYLLAWGVAALLAYGCVVWRQWKVKAKAWPPVEGEHIRRVFWMGGVSALGIAALFPKIFWESFNVDGIEAYEFGRSLTTHLFPYWEIHEGVFGFYHNFVLFSYPNHWFITFFGPVEAAARLPFFLYLVVIFCGLVLLIERMGNKKLGSAEKVVLWFGLVLYAVVQVYNTNYDPFFADIAENAATDTLAVTCFLAACWTLWERRNGWFLTFALMTYMASPGGLLLFLALGVSLFFSHDPGRIEKLRTVGLAVVACVVIGVAYESLYQPTVLAEAKNQFSGLNMLKRLYPPTVTELVRFNAILFPCGVIPALSLFFVRRNDSLGWGLAGVSVMYFGILYLQAWTSLHQFSLVMVLPLVVFWRQYLALEPNWQQWLLPMVCMTTAISLWFSLPQHFQVNIAAREFGQATSFRVGNYEDGYEEAVRKSRVLSALVPPGYRLKYPDQPWGFDPLSWVYYSTREKPAGTQINYIVQPSTAVHPHKGTPVLEREDVTVFVLDKESWQRDRGTNFPNVVVSPLYEPMLRRTYQFFRTYIESLQKKKQEKEQQSIGGSRT
jgi:hypothetical protein